MSKITRRVTTTALVAAIALTGHLAPARASAQEAPEPRTYNRAGYLPKAVPTAAIPYHDHRLEPRAPTGLVDADGVRVWKHPKITNGELVDHPVAQAQYGLYLLNTFRVTRDHWFLDRAQRQAQRLIDTRMESRGAWWFPYRFDFALHGNPDNVMESPWFSQMAQGQALSLFSRLHTTTGDDKWGDAADAAFESFLLPPDETEPWGVHVDADGFLWLEEYPRFPVGLSERVLNGHLFAVYGLWDYWSATGSRRAAALFDAALTTTARYVPNGFRNPGRVSRYGLRSGVPSEGYHRVHINQLRHMHALSGDGRFAGLAELLHRDWALTWQPSRMRFAARKHRGVKFRSVEGGALVARKKVRLSKRKRAVFSQRRRIGGRRGYWYQVRSGARLKGYWVREKRKAAARRPVGAVSYLAPRRVVLTGPRTHKAYRAHGSKKIRVSRASSAPVNRIGWVRGRWSVRVSAGLLRGYWLPLRRGVTLR